MSGEPHDLLDRDTRLGLFEDCCIGILTSQIALVLDTLGGGQQVGIDGGGANCSADVAHGSLKAGTGIASMGLHRERLASRSEARTLQRPLPDGALRIVATGEGVSEACSNLAAALQAGLEPT